MAGESTKETAEGQADTLIDDLISEIFSDSGAVTDSSMRGMATTAALLETALGPTRGSRGASKTSVLERLFLAQAFATELADTLAPALAEQLAPRLLKSLEELMAQNAEKKPAPAGSRPGTPTRKS